MIEIRMLHKRIDALESAASVDMLTHLFPRQEMEQRIREGQAPCRLLLVRAGGIVTAASQFGCAVAEELTRRRDSALAQRSAGRDGNSAMERARLCRNARFGRARGGTTGGAHGR